ncbi:MAG: YbjN domain-containing protein [Calditrichaceae bacterium]|nr:YbjN domain-containing protein [Calditrichia bacterium]NUQ41369.1 YbjN domain-containing protein [Calditrichaceae bacterium]
MNQNEESKARLLRNDTPHRHHPHALEIVGKVLKDFNWKPDEFKGDTSSGFVVFLADSLYEGGIIHLIEDEQRLVFYLEFRERASETTRSQVAEFITRANYGILIGNFEMDYSDGSIRYKTSLDFQGDELSPALIRNIIAAARNSGETYGYALIEVMKGQKSAQNAIDDVESTRIDTD